jgi:deferrochelatase/peroxidase EfeB
MGATMLGIGAGLDHVFGGPDAENQQLPKVANPEVPFYGTHQAGIATPSQDFLSFAAFDITSSSIDDLRDVLKQWTAATAALAAGRPYGLSEEGADVAPTDTGEAFGTGPSRLTITFGFGPGLLGSLAEDRFGFARKRPHHLADLPGFRGESLDPKRSGGDVCAQACADDPQVAFHAIHVLARLASGAATLRWTQQGFGRTSSTSREQPTPRNLMGFKDGTNNLRVEEEREMNKHVWVQRGDGPDWMKGGTYMVVRRIKILLDVWDTTSIEGQERAVGREKVSGAPLGRDGEHDAVDLKAKKNGELSIPANAHIRLASPEVNGDQRILRRGFSYNEPSLAGSGQLDAGLFFICFQRDPRRQFVPIQRRLAASDALGRHLLHTGSGVFACPSGASRGGFIGEGLFA